MRRGLVECCVGRSTGPFGDADRSWSQSHTHIHKVRDVRAYSLGGDVEERGLGLGEDEARELAVVVNIYVINGWDVSSVMAVRI